MVCQVYFEALIMYDMKSDFCHMLALSFLQLITAINHCYARSFTKDSRLNLILLEIVRNTAEEQV